MSRRTKLPLLLGVVVLLVAGTASGSTSSTPRNPGVKRVGISGTIGPVCFRRSNVTINGVHTGGIARFIELGQHCYKGEQYRYIHVRLKVKRAGLRGARGFAGPAGPEGPAGAAGATGETGAQGAKGDTGATGAQGFQGEQGEQGERGFMGLQGLIGPAGAQGDVGPMGPMGPQGAKGDTGATGAKGDTRREGDTARRVTPRREG